MSSQDLSITDQPIELPEPRLSLLNNLRERPAADPLDGMPSTEDADENIGPITEYLRSVVDTPDHILLGRLLPCNELRPVSAKFNGALPQDAPRHLRDEYIGVAQYLLMGQSDEIQNPFNQHHKTQLDEYRKLIGASNVSKRVKADPEGLLIIWRYAYTKLRDQLLEIERLGREILDVAEQTHAIVESLRGRDDRFFYICSACKEFIDGDGGIRDACRSASLVAHVDLNQLDDAETIYQMNEIMTDLIKFALQDPSDRINHEGTFCEIMDSAIYEMLNVFGEQISHGQTPLDTSYTTRFKFLRDLYEKSELLTPQPATLVAPKSQTNNGNQKCYNYPTRLNSENREVRVIQILPGSRDEPLKCHLVVRKLEDDGIPEALSYVWGKGAFDTEILIDGQPFPVTSHLDRILRGLRHHANTAREIWIDAICINQSDSKERADQVRLMAQIYSRAKKTTIWLSGDHSANEEEEGPALDPINYMEEHFEIDQDNLTEILEKFQEYSIDDTLSEQNWAFYIMLIRCMTLILSHPWWGRVWTIQEAACPPIAPIFVFRGRTFSFGDLMTARDIMGKVAPKLEHIAEQDHDAVKSKGELAIKLLATSNLGSMEAPLLFHYRRGLEIDRRRGPKSFSDLLFVSSSSQASEPRDKIFALQSLLPRLEGLLINVDYNEYCEVVFRRATARCYSVKAGFVLMGSLRFWFESALSADEPIGPSWVLDFLRSGPGSRGSRSGSKLDAFVFKHNFPQDGLELDFNDFEVLYCTPSTLYCTGRYIDVIRALGPITKCDDSNTLSRLALKPFADRQSLLGLPVLAEIDHFMRNGGTSLMRFFLMQDQGGEETELTDELVSARNQELVGKQFFVTEKGLVGIATAPIKQGDILSLIHGSPVYLILREVKDHGTTLDHTPQHQIVARAAVNDRLVPGMKDMKAFVNSVPSCQFRIV
ncbi:heterokaryon incompatibility protein-domain-containing protein [Nemania abortiva]|nr:heterokaryon incompatibility protein-domain-containing protein [Nemania abortiva]